MKHIKRLRFDQQKFLRGMRDGEVMLPELLRAGGVAPARLARWMRRVYFRESLESMRGEVRRRQWLDVELLARAAQNTLRAMLTGEQTRDGALMAICRAILEEYHRAFQRRRQRRQDRRRNGGKNRPSALSFERELVHPAMAHRKEELLKILLGKTVGETRGEAREVVSDETRVASDAAK